ncbi:hypothetical protein [Clostridium sp. ZBS18]|uniref:hypothetical protein n=1 Tax=Clostridium sp. ZBS18 TaxID=2949967 RepID=UPI00338DB585
MEVIFGLANSLGYSEEGLLKARHKKKVERKGFEKGILLKVLVNKFRDKLMIKETKQEGKDIYEVKKKPWKH